MVNTAACRIKRYKELETLTPPEMAISRGFGGVWNRKLKKVTRWIASTAGARRREERLSRLGNEVFFRIEVLYWMIDE